MIIAFHFKCDEFFSFQFNPVRSVILRNITFVFDEILKEIIISFLFIQTRSHMTNVFSLHDKQHTSNQTPLFPTMTLLSTSFFQHFSSSNNLSCQSLSPFDPIIAILKSRQMNTLFILINYIQSIESLG